MNAWYLLSIRKKLIENRHEEKYNIISYRKPIVSRIIDKIRNQECHINKIRLSVRYIEALLWMGSYMQCSIAEEVSDWCVPYLITKRKSLYNLCLKHLVIIPNWTQYYLTSLVLYVVHHMLFKHLDIKKDDTDNKNVDIKVSAHQVFSGLCIPLL